LRATTQRKGVASAAAGPAAEDAITLNAGPAIGKQGMYIDTGFYGANDKMTAPVQLALSQRRRVPVPHG